MKIKKLFILLVGTVLFYSNAVTQHLRTYAVLPKLTDNAINTYTEAGDEHYIYLSDSIEKVNKLFVFLPGTGGRGKNPRIISTYAASVGYHTIALTYPSDVALAQMCRNTSDDSCFNYGRREICFGDDVSVSWDVNKANCIENRLQKLLVYLKDNYPADNWSQFLTKNNEINWEKICISGQSQGGGHAAFIGMQRKLDRVIMFASPKDFSLGLNKPGAWLGAKSITPINRFFGFVHTMDETNGCTWEEQKQIFTLMGFDALGKWENVDDQQPPYNHTRTLTSLKPQDFPHGSVIRDTNYQVAWRYMLLEKTSFQK